MTEEQLDLATVVSLLSDRHWLFEMMLKHLASDTVAFWQIIDVPHQNDPL